MSGKMSEERTVYYLEGDGIGPEIWAVARPIIDAALMKDGSKPLQWRELLAGEKAVAETGSSLPTDTLETLKNASLAMKGPLGTPVGTGIRSLNVALRHGLDLYACIRPIRHMPGLETPVKHPEWVDMTIFRENSEDLYAGIEFDALSPEAKKVVSFLREEMNVAKLTEDAAIGIKPMTERASKRLVAKAIEYALKNGKKNVTLVHKGNIMKFTEGGFRRWGYEVAKEQFGDQCCTAANPEPGRLLIRDRIADAMFQEALLHPRNYDVLATPNLNGDYLSDAIAAQVGGLGLAPGVNMSDTLAFYEATHGTAPDIAGKDRANPGSLLLCGAMLLDHIGEAAPAARIRKALEKAIAGRKVTPDLAENIPDAEIIGCREFADIIGENL